MGKKAYIKVPKGQVIRQSSAKQLDQSWGPREYRSGSLLGTRERNTIFLSPLLTAADRSIVVAACEAADTGQPG